MVVDSFHRPSRWCCRGCDVLPRREGHRVSGGQDRCVPRGSCIGRPRAVVRSHRGGRGGGSGSHDQRCWWNLAQAQLFLERGRATARLQPPCPHQHRECVRWCMLLILPQQKVCDFHIWQALKRQERDIVSETEKREGGGVKGGSKGEMGGCVQAE